MNNGDEKKIKLKLFHKFKTLLDQNKNPKT